MAVGPKSSISLLTMWDTVFEQLLDDQDNGVGDVTVRLDEALEMFKTLYGDLTRTSYELPAEIFEQLVQMYKEAGWANIEKLEGRDYGPNPRIVFTRKE